MPGVQRCRSSHAPARTAAAVLLQRLPPTRLSLAARSPRPYRRHRCRARAERVRRLRSLPRGAHASRLRQPVPRPSQPPTHGVRRARELRPGAHIGRRTHYDFVFIELHVVPSLRRPRQPNRSIRCDDGQPIATTSVAVGALDTSTTTKPPTNAARRSPRRRSAHRDEVTSARSPRPATRAPRHQPAPPRPLEHCTSNSSCRHSTISAPSSAVRARTVTAHTLKNSAAAPWISALRANRPRAAATCGHDRCRPRRCRRPTSEHVVHRS